MHVILFGWLKTVFYICVRTQSPHAVLPGLILCEAAFLTWFDVYQLEKVDTEKIFQLNIFSKVDNRDIFVRFDFTKVDILNRFTSFSFSKVYTFPKSLSDSTVARLFRTNLGSVVNSLFSNVPLHFISPLLYRFL